MGRLTLPRHSRVYLDAAPIIYSVEEHPDYWLPLQDVWALLDNGDLEILTSELSLLETLVVPIREGDSELVAAYENLLTSFKVDLIPVTASLLRSAAELRAKHNFKTPDAIHAATASFAGCSHFVTNDPAFRRLADLEVVVLGDLL